LFTRIIILFIINDMEQKKKCNSCKKTKLTLKEWGMVLTGIYMFSMAVYGTIHFFKHLFS